MPVVYILYKWLMISAFSFSSSLFAPRSELIFSSIAHPFFISVTQIEYNNQQNSIEISCKLFADDFEMALKKIHNRPFDLSAPAGKEIKHEINEYILRRLIFELDGKKLTPQYLGFEKEGEAVYLYFEATGIDSFKKLNLQNSILQDYTKEQINIVHVLVNGKRQSTRMTHSGLTASFSF